ncbi:MAG TPA: tetratricopeptide repeat protein, partial [Chloroflexota bacterium]|nr:tetratricopeptide repeat protein [Chloroflexota bacterium]
MSTSEQPLDLVGWEIDLPAEAESRFRDALPGAEAAGDDVYLAELLTQLARTQSLQGRFEEAHALLDRVEGLLIDGMARPRIRLLLERGRTLNSSGAAAEAQPLFLEAYLLGTDSGEEYLAVDALHMLAIVSPPPDQIDWARRGIEMAETSEDPQTRRWLGALYNNLGWTYHDLGQYEAALECFRRALEVRR